MTEYSVNDRVLVPGVVTSEVTARRVVAVLTASGEAVNIGVHDLRPDTGGRDLTARDVQEALASAPAVDWRQHVAGYLNRIARGDAGSAGDEACTWAHPAECPVHGAGDDTAPPVDMRHFIPLSSRHQAAAELQRIVHITAALDSDPDVPLGTVSARVVSAAMDRIEELTGQRPAVAWEEPPATAGPRADDEPDVMEPLRREMRDGMADYEARATAGPRADDEPDVMEPLRREMRDGMADYEARAAAGPRAGDTGASVRDELHLSEGAPESAVVGRIQLLKARYERLSAAAGHVVPAGDDTAPSQGSTPNLSEMAARVLAASRELGGEYTTPQGAALETLGVSFEQAAPGSVMDHIARMLLAPWPTAGPRAGSAAPDDEYTKAYQRGAKAQFDICESEHGDAVELDRLRAATVPRAPVEALIAALNRNENAPDPWRRLNDTVAEVRRHLDGDTT